MAPIEATQTPPELTVSGLFEDLIPDLFTWIGDHLEGLGIAAASYFVTTLFMTFGAVLVMMALIGGGLLGGVGAGALIESGAVAEAVGVPILVVLALLFYVLYIGLVLVLNLCLSLLPAGVLKTLEQSPDRRWIMAPFACFNTRDAFGLIVANFLVGLASSFGALFCLLPGILVAGASLFVTPAIVLDGLGPLAAIRRSWSHSVQHILWSLVLMALVFGVNLFAAFIPFVGQVVAPILTMLIVWRAYRAAFPAPGSPALLEAEEAGPDERVEDEGLSEEHQAPEHGQPPAAAGPGGSDADQADEDAD